MIRNQDMSFLLIWTVMIFTIVPSNQEYGLIYRVIWWVPIKRILLYAAVIEMQENEPLSESSQRVGWLLWLWPEWWNSYCFIVKFERSNKKKKRKELTMIRKSEKEKKHSALMRTKSFQNIKNSGDLLFSFGLSLWHLCRRALETTAKNIASVFPSTKDVINLSFQ